MPAGPVWQRRSGRQRAGWCAVPGSRRCGLIDGGDFIGIGQDRMCSLQRIKTRGGSTAGAREALRQKLALELQFLNLISQQEFFFHSLPSSGPESPRT